MTDDLTPEQEAWLIRYRHLFADITSPMAREVARINIPVTRYPRDVWCSRCPQVAIIEKRATGETVSLCFDHVDEDDPSVQGEY